MVQIRVLTAWCLLGMSPVTGLASDWRDWFGGRCPPGALSSVLVQIQQSRVASTDFRTLSLEKKIELLSSLGRDRARFFMETRGQTVTVVDHRMQSHVLERVPGQGAANQGIYSYRAVDGTRRVIKLLEAVPFPRGHQSGAESAVFQTRAAYLGESVGAPKVYGFGILHRTELGKKTDHYYIEMEHLFPTDSRAQVFKTWSRKLARNSGLLSEELLKFKTASGNSLPEEMADAFVALIRHRIDPADPDFIISNRGQLRWIDTGSWKIRGENDFPDRFAATAGLVVRRLDSQTPAGRLFVRRFVDGVTHEKTISHAQKIALLREFLETPRLSSLPVAAETLEQFLSRGPMK